ncbi:hypothetical protein E4U54_007814, partial [Claviceps lovelessii]
MPSAKTASSGGLPRCRTTRKVKIVAADERNAGSRRDWPRRITCHQMPEHEVAKQPGAHPSIYYPGEGRLIPDSYVPALHAIFRYEISIK